MSQCCNLLPRAAGSFALVLFLIGFGFLPATTQAGPTFSLKGSQGIVQTLEISEASGIVASRQNAGVLWTHNDSSFRGTLFALSTNGALLGRYTLYPRPFSGDFEDIAIGPGPSPDFHYIYLGDIGDNLASRFNIHVYRFPEPAVYPRQADDPVTAFVAGAQMITLFYPSADGPANAEAMMVDPITGDLFIATKSLTGTRIYRATRAQMDGGDPVTLTFVREVLFAKVSGGDISPDGRLIALRRGNTGGVWIRQPGESVGDALGRAGILIPIVGEPSELNGEAIGFDPNSLGYYTISEGLNQPIYYFRRTDTGAPRQPVSFINAGDAWRYRDLGTDEHTAWRQPEFDDSAWATGAAPLGYGEGDEVTTVASGPLAAKFVTTYFRRQFNVGATASLNNLGLRLLFTDGVAIYLNGTEVYRRNLPAEPAFDQLSTDSNSARQNDWVSFVIDASFLRVGTNTLAVELHRQRRDGYDLSFDLQLIQGAFDLSPNLNATDTRPPIVAFTTPAANAVVTDANLTVRGTASDSLGIARVACAVGAGGFQPATGTTAWSATVPLEIGTNIVFVVAHDASSNVSAIVSRKFVRLAASPLNLTVTGAGTVLPDLDGATLILGKSYVVTAKPATRNFFVGWTGGLAASGPRLQFLMQSNLTLQANFVTNPFVATKGAYRGLFEVADPVSHERSGSFTATIAESGRFTAALRFGGKAVSLSGQMGLDGKVVKPVIVQGTNLLTVALCLDLSDGADRLTGSIDGANWTAPLLAFRSPLFGKTNTAPWAGRYTMFIGGATNPTGPAGHGVASLVVSPTGVLTLSGTLADGVNVAHSGPVSREGLWPFYLPLYRGKGSVLGWLMFTNDATDSLRARVHWIKPAVPADKLYPGGFTNSSLAYGSTYSAPLMTNYLAAHPDSCLTVSGLAPGIQTNCVVLGPGYAWNGPGVKSLKLDLSTGLWSGTYTNPATGRPLPAKFTVLLQSGSGFGYVLSTNVSAAVEEWTAP